MHLRAALPLIFVLSLGASGCDEGPHHVTFDDERCLLDGEPATVDRVEAEQTRLSRRVLSRQPIQTAITLAVLLIAGATYIEKMVALLVRRRGPVSEQRTLTARMRAVLDAQRDHPWRYFAIVGGLVGLILVGGGVYLDLDADKRASERALAQLQFCHLALKSAEEKAAIEVQKKNLDALQATAGDIKTLVDSLPPEEQRKAAQLLAQMRSALGNQHQLLQRESQVASAVQARSAEIQKNLGALSAEVVGLRSLPVQLKTISDELARVDARTKLRDKGPQTLGDELAALHNEVQASSEKLGQTINQVDCGKSRLPSGKTVAEALAELSARPAPVCRCECGVASARDGGSR